MAPELCAAVIRAELGDEPDARLRGVGSRSDRGGVDRAGASRAITHDGRHVAVKVQYPGVDDAIAPISTTGDLLFRAMSLMFPGLDPTPTRRRASCPPGRGARLRPRSGEPTPVRRVLRRSSVHPHPERDRLALDVSACSTTEFAEGARFSEVEQWSQERARPRRRDDLPLRVPQPLPPARVQRRPAPRQLPVPRRRCA